MPGHAKYILTIGGFDPCNGAGITQDIKTLDSHGVYALSVMTCLTVQNEDVIMSVEWMSLDVIKDQIDVLAEKYAFDWVKISLIRNLDTLLDIINHLQDSIPAVKIVWDPVQTSSSGFEFNDQKDDDLLTAALGKLFLATPNWKEIKNWGSRSPEEIAKRLSAFTNIYLKGGHRPGKQGVDTLYTKAGSQEDFMPERVSAKSKHGSGCVFAAALVANLNRGNDLDQAISEAKNYVIDFLESRDGLLGSHLENNKSKVSIEI